MVDFLKAFKAIPRVSFSVGAQRERSWIPHHPGPNFAGWTWPTEDEAETALAQADRSSIVDDCVSYRAENAIKTPFVLVRRDGSETVTDHDVLDFLNKPAPGIDGSMLLMLWWYGLDIKGNAYGVWVEGDFGQAVELWPIVPTTMRPVTSRSGMLSHYEHRPGDSQIQRYAIENVVHLKMPNPFGSVWEGRSPLYSVGSELWLDREATRHATAIFKNAGRPGFIGSPDLRPEDEPPTDEEWEAVKDEFREAYSGPNRGRPALLKFPFKVHNNEYRPDQMHLPEIHAFAESRIGGRYRLPLALVQFLSGLKNTTTNATLKEWEKQAWEASIIPGQDRIARQMTSQVLPVLMGDEAMQWQLGYDRSMVEVLQEDDNREAERWKNMTGGPVALVSEARQAQGLEVGPEHEFMWVPLSLTGTAPEDLIHEAQPVPDNLTPFPMPTNDDEEEDDAAEATRALPRMSRLARGLVRQLSRDENRLRDRFARDLTSIFESLGRAAERAYQDQADALPTRQLGPGDEALISRLINVVDIQVPEDQLVEVYERHAIRTLQTTFGNVNGALGLNLNLPDPVQREVIRQGGTRAGLVDLSQQTRDSVFKALHRGRSEGLGADELGRMIREYGGRWSLYQDGRDS